MITTAIKPSQIRDIKQNLESDESCNLDDLDYTNMILFPLKDINDLKSKIEVLKADEYEEKLKHKY